MHQSPYPGLAALLAEYRDHLANLRPATIYDLLQLADLLDHEDGAA